MNAVRSRVGLIFDILDLEAKGDETAEIPLILLDEGAGRSLIIGKDEG